MSFGSIITKDSCCTAFVAHMDQKKKIPVTQTLQFHSRTNIQKHALIFEHIMSYALYQLYWSSYKGSQTYPSPKFPCCSQDFDILNIRGSNHAQVSQIRGKLLQIGIKNQTQKATLGLWVGIKIQDKNLKFYFGLEIENQTLENYLVGIKNQTQLSIT